MHRQGNAPAISWRKRLAWTAQRLADGTSVLGPYALHPANWLGLGLSAGALFLSLRQIQWENAQAALMGLNGPLVVLTLVTAITTTLAKGLRWRRLLVPHRVPLKSLLFALAVGQVINGLLPGRVGELARAYLLDERVHLGKARLLGTILVEKLLDTLMLLALLLTVLVFSGNVVPSWFRTSALPLAGIAFLLLALLLLAGKARSLLKCSFRLLPSRWRQRLLRSLEGMGDLHQVGILAGGLGWSLLIWALAAGTNYVLLGAFRLEQQVPVVASIVILVAIHLGSLLPTAPAQIGVFHYLCLVSLAAFGVQRSAALSYAVVLHVAVYLPTIILGSLGLWRERWNLGHLGWARGIESGSR
jgi:uncharacterized protein (TIRG00374 family)